MCIRTADNVTLVVQGQEDDAEQPRVEPGTQLHGSILLERTENIKSVVLQIEGLLETLPLPSSYMSIPLFRITEELYTIESPSSTPAHNFAFSHSLPPKFRYHDKLYPLPPTCHVSFDNLHFVKCAYRITVTVVSARHRRASFLTKSNHVSFELNYRPRTRPSQPLIANPSLVETVKLCPEEWTQCSKVVDVSRLPVLCDVSFISPSGMISMLNRKYQLFMPSIRAFCVEDPIPFHLQLSSVESSHPNIGSAEPPRVKVRIMRRITMIATDRMAERCIVLGEGTLQPLPTHGTHATLNWQGEAHCRDPRSIVGTFDCGPAVAVMDMLVIDILPPLGCPVQHASFGFPIKLTTHRWDHYD
ncbi:hypothetical protein DFH08DRAFT_338093 [Mycena albidolilacea]|uniref:Uncharacterized protein n=1 Tax=Mycena albidolilacea TaxID=1033008 RepID=A0AAD6ZK26_9AGAR|nr:hypothetical protein DFH08DRAFT_338093 [Mycena albidolilacea]